MRDSAPSHRRRWAAHGPFLLLFCIYAAWLLVALPQYGVTWDVPFEFPRATAYLNHFLSGVADPSLSPWHEMSYESAKASTTGSSNGCLPSLFAALTGKIFFEWWGLLDHVDGYHLGLTLIWIAAVAHFYWRMQALHGPAHALLATIILGCSPRIIGHVHNNMKDLPCMAFAMAGYLEMVFGIKKDRPARLFGAGFLFGCALSSKFVVLFVAVPVAADLWMRFRTVSWYPRVPGRFRLPIVAMPLIAMAVLIGHWPHFWVPPGELWVRLAELHEMISLRTGSGHPTIYPVAMIVITTTVPVLAGLFLAALFTIRPSRAGITDPMLRACWVWLLTVLLVFSSGTIAVFDGIRHFLLIWPPIAVLSAWGMLQAMHWAATRFARLSKRGPWLYSAAVCGLLTTSISSISLYHPYEITYFNVLVGGLPGATRLDFGRYVLDFEPRDYWGTSIRRTIRWANENLPRGAAVWINNPYHLNDIYKLRADLRGSADDRRFDLRPRHLVFLNRPKTIGESDRAALAAAHIVHQETVRGVPLTMIVRFPK